MNAQWKQHLIESGAEFDEDSLQSFGNPERERRIAPQGDILCDLSRVGLIRVSGEDASAFLQNQLTNNIEEVTPGRAQLSAWCNPKGRVIATFLIHQRENAYYLCLAADLVETVLKKLRMYVLMSKVELEDVSQQLVHFGASGEHIEKDWGMCCKEEGLPKEDYDVVSSGGISVVRIPGEVPRFEVFGELEEAKTLWNKLAVRAAPVSAASWDYMNIAAGMPVVTEASSEAWIPQMLNLQIINGVSFKKGCFPGQEVVARLKYLGKNKRRAYRVGFVTDQIPETGAAIYTADGDEAGKVLNAALNPDGTLETLSILKIDKADEPLHLASADGAAGELLELPFAVEEVDE